MIKNSICLWKKRKPIYGHAFRYKYYVFGLPLAIASIFLLLMNIGVEVSFKSTEIRISWTRLVNNKSIDAPVNNINDDKYFIKTKGCTIHAFHPFDRSVVKYFQMEKPISCYNYTNPPLVESNLTSLWIEEMYYANYGIIEEEQLVCCYRPFFRQDSNINTSDDRYEYKNDCTVFSKSTNIFDEFIRVECTYEGEEIYKDFHSFVTVKNKIETKTERNDFNVLILGIDAVSRMNFHRTMPQTLKVLKDIGAIEFRGYNKVGDNTFPNLVPILSGLSERELTNLCLPKSDSTFDDCPFIWKKFKESGYTTAFAEDASQISVFNYMKNGFIEAPTDYYWRTFNLAAEEEIGHEIHLNAKLCIGPRITANVLLDYIYKFLTVLSNNLYFGFFWETSLTHDFLNYPLLGDYKYSALISKLKNEKLLEKTVVIVLSDHGIRWGDIRATFQGRMEERLPFLFIILPKTFEEKFPLASSNLKLNTKRLTTPYDLHETLLDLLNTNQIEDEEIEQRIIKRNYENDRGLSLFLPINESRTCQTADINPHWCTCQQTQKLNVEEKIVVYVANVVINYINDLLNNKSACAKLNLNKIVEARISGPSNSLEIGRVFNIVQDYTVIINTQPGDGIFEATVRHSLKGWNITGTISRINLYGDQSYCIDDFHLKLYCFCNISI